MLNEFRVEEGEVLEDVGVDIDEDDLLYRRQVCSCSRELGVKVRNVFVMFLTNNLLNREVFRE